MMLGAFQMAITAEFCGIEVDKIAVGIGVTIADSERVKHTMELINDGHVTNCAIDESTSVLIREGRNETAVIKQHGNDFACICRAGRYSN